MYKVKWRDREENLHEREFSKLRDANLEAERLSEKYDMVYIERKYTK